MQGGYMIRVYGLCLSLGPGPGSGLGLGLQAEPTSGLRREHIYAPAPTPDLRESHGSEMPTLILLGIHLGPGVGLRLQLGLG